MEEENMEMLIDSEACWNRVLNRDSNGGFFYGVRSTGIYCRPSCPSKRPGRNQVEFFQTPESAERKGFRPCRRCKPDEAGSEWVKRVCCYISENLDDSLNLDSLAKIAGFSAAHFQRAFKRTLGISPREYVDSQRINRF